jgi:hypothetical protein
LRGSLQEDRSLISYEGHRAGFEDAIVVVVRDSSAKQADGKLKVVQIPAKEDRLRLHAFCGRCP